MVGDKNKLMLCAISALRKYLSQMEQYRPGISNLFVLTAKRKKRVSLFDIGMDWPTATLMSLLLIRIAGWSGSRHTNSGRL